MTLTQAFWRLNCHRIDSVDPELIYCVNWADSESDPSLIGWISVVGLINIIFIIRNVVASGNVWKNGDQIPQLKSWSSTSVAMLWIPVKMVINEIVANNLSIISIGAKFWWGQRKYIITKTTIWLLFSMLLLCVAINTRRIERMHKVYEPRNSPIPKKKI